MPWPSYAPTLLISIYQTQFCVPHLTYRLVIALKKDKPRINTATITVGVGVSEACFAFKKILVSACVVHYSGTATELSSVSFIQFC